MAATRRSSERRWALLLLVAAVVRLLLPVGLSFAPAVTWAVRFTSQELATRAVEEMDGSELKGKALKVEHDGQSKDRTRVLVEGLEWKDVGHMDLKEHFSQVGKPRWVTEGVAEVRFEAADAATRAIEELTGSVVTEGRSGIESTITVVPHPTSTDGTKVKVFGITPSCGFACLKGHFGKVGKVLFVGAPGEPGTKR
eukprot:TRINITY_DN103316_c0_g1_i1.p2 TRINITY_DN103316_c0_g1~~TRINITY_DN103316_c0_g1_i1.p2  ORF type:complete len:197 (+),score=50.87 TRINITY_DN103316_c0_g1_i1:133-723(+)